MKEINEWRKYKCGRMFISHCGIAHTEFAGFLRRVTLKCIYHNLNVAPKKLDSRLYHSVLIFSYLYIKIGFISLYMFVNLLSHIVSVLNGVF
jgi:hypothetical protein